MNLPHESCIGMWQHHECFNFQLIRNVDLQSIIYTIYTATDDQNIFLNQKLFSAENDLTGRKL